MADKNAPKEDEVLLTELRDIVLFIYARGLASEPQYKGWADVQADQILTKAREAVEGAGLTDEDISTTEMPCDEDSRNCPIDTANSYDPTSVACQLCSHRITAEAQTKAALKALGMEGK